MHNDSVRTAFLLTAMILLGGCASISSVQTADTLGKGGFQLGVEPGVLAAADIAPTSTAEPAWIPHIDVSARWGVSEGVDLGLRAGLSLLEFQSKFLVTRPGDPRLAVSLAPTLGGLVLSTREDGVQGVLNFALPLLIGVKLAGNELVLGVRVQNLLLFTGRDRPNIFGVGAGVSIGYAWHITERFGLMPEAALMVPVVGGEAFAQQFKSTSALQAGITLFQFKLGILIGRFRKADDFVEQQKLPPAPSQSPLPTEQK